MKVWTFLIKGGEFFGMDFEDNPSLEHSQFVTLWKYFGSEYEVEVIREEAESFGCNVCIYSQEEDEEAKELRNFCSQVHRENDGDLHEN